MTIHTSLLTPTHIFQKEQQLLVPLFQRPYTWNRKEQWEPLWADVMRVATRLLEGKDNSSRPHFLGAIVLQQMPNKSGDLEYRTVIDGQQRLTTLQILLDSIHAELTRHDLKSPAAKLVGLIENGEVFRKSADDKFKLWPTNLDRAAFRALMSAQSPIDYKDISIEFQSSKFYQGHKYFAEEARTWLSEEGTWSKAERADALVKTLRDQLQLVVIDLDTTDDAQEIFETLNARGAKLESSDLIKNFVFQRLTEEGGSSLAESFYKEHWFKFETSFWVETISVGREKFQRSSLFLFHWIVSKTAADLVEREVFSRFKEYTFDCGQSMSEIVSELSDSADIYREKIIQSGDSLEGNLSRLGLFVYRTSVMETSVARPLLLEVLNPRKEVIPNDQLIKFLDVIESWLVRRFLARATSKGYNKVFVDAISIVQKNRHKVGDALEAFFATQSNFTTYWPDDQELRTSIKTMPFYNKFGKGRQRMVLEALEDYLRGWVGTSESASGTRVKRGTFQIEHVMPQSWQANWPLPATVSERDRDEAVQRLGNLSLLSKKLNNDVSNSGWNASNGKDGKREAFVEKDLLQINKKLLEVAQDDWNEEKIADRTELLISAMLDIWKVPAGHSVVFNSIKQEEKIYVEVVDLLEFGSLYAGQVLYPKPKKYEGIRAEILQDGRIVIGDSIFASPSAAAEHLRKSSANGWRFWLVDKNSKKSLSDVRAEYRESLSIDPDDSDSLEEDET
jgi:uncharacterized protein with ParB-like and HNH nuclease domain